MPTRFYSSVLRVGSVCAIVAAIAGCTKGGQFDPTTVLDNDMFNNKTAIKGQREPVFPNGVPGVSNGIPPDLVEGYKPPPDQTANAGDPGAAGPPAAEPPKPTAELKPKPKPKRKIARAKPPHPRTEISVGLTHGTAKPAEQQPPDQTAWPAPGQAQAGPPPSQTAWPAPPPPGAVQQAARPQQSIWPAPPAPGTSQQ